MPRPRPRRIAAFGFFGIGNLGNEGSLAALLEHLRSLDADIEIRCLVGDPEVVRQEHGVVATALMSHRSLPGAGGRVELLRKAWSRVVDVPRIWRMVGQVDVVVVPGMGVLEASLDDANVWGFPLWQFLAALAARLRRRSFVLLSVGAGFPENRWVRFYFRSTLRLAGYTTFRDRGSRAAADRMGGRAVPGTVSADLAFGLAAPELTDPQPGRIVLGVMTPDVRGDTADVVAGYIEKVSQAVVRLLDGGHSVRLVVGDLADRPLAERIAGQVDEQRRGLEVGALAISDADTLHGLMTEMVQAEVVVASRYHNLICALMASRPTVSLGYAEKGAELLVDFGLAGYNQSMTAFDVDVLDRQVRELRARRSALEPQLVRTVERMRVALDDQYRDFDARVLRL